MDNSSTATTETGETATQGTGTGTSVEDNGQPNGEATEGQSATGSENFIPQGVDVNSLPPALRAHVEKINKEMVRGFTEKTQQLAEKIKAETEKSVSSYKQKAEWFDRVSANDVARERINKVIEELTREAQQQQQQTGHVDESLKQEVRQIKTELETEKMTQYVNAFADAKDEKGTPLHPEFEKYASLSVGKLPDGSSASLLRIAAMVAPGNTAQEKLTNGYKAAEQFYKSILEEGRKLGMGRVQAKVRNGSIPPTSSASTNVANRRPKNALEAIEMARQGLAPAE